MRAIEVGVRELQRGTSDVMARVCNEGLHAIVSRYGRPVAVIVPVTHAQAWILQNRPLRDEVTGDDSFWPTESGVRLGPVAEANVADLSEPIRRRLFTQLRKLRRFEAVGRVAIRAGHLWALADLAGDAPPTILELARSADLRRWFYAPSGGGQPM